MPAASLLILPTALLLLLGAPLAAGAIPAVTCHCFTDRSFDPARPGAADPYLLATAQNSFFAAVFGVDKGSIVMLKQRGIAADDLWIAYWVAARTGQPVNSLLNREAGWAQALSPLQLPPQALGLRFTEALREDATAGRMAEIIVDALVATYRLLDDPEREALRKVGAANQDLLLAALLSVWSGQPATALYRDVRSGATSWGALLDKAGITPPRLQTEIGQLVGSRRQEGRVPRSSPAEPAPNR